MSDNPKPVHTVRIGFIQGAIWSNPGQHGPFYNVTFERRYRDEQEQWQGSDSYGRDDLLVLAKVADIAHSFICDRQAADRSQAAETDNASAPNAALAARGRQRSR